MLSIDYDIGYLGGFVILLMIGAGAIVAVWFLAAARQLKRSADEDADDRAHEHPER